MSPNYLDDNNDIKFISTPLKCCGTFEDILFESFSFFVLGSLCPISHLYHYLHYALWGISYNLAQATLSVLCHYVTNCQRCWRQISTRDNKETLQPALLRFSWSWGGPWLEDVSGCSPLSGIVCFLPAMILHDTLMVTINALIGQLNRIKSNLPAWHARKI